MPELIRLGIKAREGNPQLLDRLRETEENNKKLSNKLQLVAKALYEIKKRYGEI